MPLKRIFKQQPDSIERGKSMAFGRLIPQKPEEQYVEHIRKSVRFWDAWKSWVIVGSVTMLIVLVAFLNWLFSLFSTPDPGGLVPSENYARMWMLLAFIFGMQFGMNVYEWLAYVVKASVGGYRTERLLLAMYDTRTDNQQGEADD